MCGCYVVFDNGNKDAMYNVQVPVHIHFLLCRAFFKVKSRGKLKVVNWRVGAILAGSVHTGTVLHTTYIHTALEKINVFTTYSYNCYSWFFCDTTVHCLNYLDMLSYIKVHLFLQFIKRKFSKCKIKDNCTLIGR